MKFKISDNVLKRCDRNMLTQYTRNEAYAEFSFSHEWKELEPKTAQFRNGDDSYDVLINDGKCTIPWEVLTERGTLEVTVLGGDLKTTNTVRINIVGNGLIGGLVPTKASPSVYSYLVGLYENLKASVEKILSGCFSDVDITAKNLNVSKKATIPEIVSDFATSTYTSVKNKLKFGSSGFDLSVESKKDNGTTYKHQIKTSNSKMQINAADLEVNSDKNERHNVEGNFQIRASNDIEIEQDGAYAFKVSSGRTRISAPNNGSNYIEADQSNVNVFADNDIALNANNIRSEVDDTYEVINGSSSGTGIIRLINQNEPENRSVKLYLGSDYLTIGVDDQNYSTSEIVSGLKITKDAVKIISNDDTNGTPIMDKVTDNVNTALENASKSSIDSVYNALALNHGGIKAVYNCGLGSGDSASEDIKAIVCRDNSVIIYGDGDMFGREDELYSNEDISLLNGVYIAEGVTNISERYFSGFTNLSKIVLPNTVSSIEQYAFYNCKNLEGIYIPKKVVSIENYTFYNCSALRSAVLPESLQSIGSSAFYRCSALEDINIPETVTSIGINAFNGCSSLTAITIPDSVISIGKNAFSSCDKLTTINIVGDTDSIPGSPWGAVNAEIVWNYGK